MRTISIELYSFDELNEEAKKVAIEQYRDVVGFEHSNIWDEAHKTVEAFHDNFFTKEGNNSWLTWWFNGLDNAADVTKMTGLRLRTWLLNNMGDILYKPKFIGSLKRNKVISHRRVKSKALSNGNVFNPYYSGVQMDTSCTLTGMYYDDVLLSCFHEFIDGGFLTNKKTLPNLLDEAFHRLKKAIDEEMEEQESDESISEILIDNEYEFTKDGKISTL